MRVLRPGGRAASLAEYGRSGQYALDLQLRGYAGGTHHWATLYAGLTKVLDLHLHDGRGYRLDAHPTWKAHDWSPDWERYAQDGFSHDEWSAVEVYLET